MSLRCCRLLEREVSSGHTGARPNLDCIAPASLRAGLRWHPCRQAHPHLCSPPSNIPERFLGAQGIIMKAQNLADQVQ